MTALNSEKREQLVRSAMADLDAARVTLGRIEQTFVDEGFDIPMSTLLSITTARTRMAEVGAVLSQCRLV